MAEQISPLRCPGFRAPDSARCEHHLSWRPRDPDSVFGSWAENRKHFECVQCEAKYDYLVDLRTGTRVGPDRDSEPAAHPDDPEHYKPDRSPDDSAPKRARNHGN